MSQFMSNPTGAGFGNTMDPLSNLDALERRKREMAQAQAEFDAARERARAKREAEEAARRPASAEAPASAPTAPAAAAPAAKPNASTSASAAEPDKYSLLRKAAQDRYQAELSRMADISTSGGVVPPLSSKRAGQRYENELNRLAAIQAMERDRAARREALVSRVNERKAAQSARRAQIAAMRQRQADEASQAGIAEARDIIQAGQSVNPAALQERQFLDRLMEGALAPRTPTTNPIRAAVAQTPTGRLMDLAKPTDAVPHPYSQEINDLRDPVFGRPDPGVGYMGEYREDPLNPRTLQTREAYDVADPAFGSPFYMGPLRPNPNQPDLTDPQLEQLFSDAAALARRPSPMTDTQLEQLSSDVSAQASQPVTLLDQINRQLAQTRKPSRMSNPPQKPREPQYGEVPPEVEAYDRMIAEGRPIIERSIAANQAAEAERQRRLAELARYPEVARLLNELASPGGLR